MKRRRGAPTMSKSRRASAKTGCRSLSGFSFSFWRLRGLPTSICFEKKLIGWSLGIGVVLLIILAIVNHLFPASICRLELRRRRLCRREMRKKSMSPIPKTAPFAEEEIDLLNRVVGTASPVQRAWLAGFLAGLDASGATLVPAHPAAPPRPAEPLTIVYASESGNSEKLAGDLAKAVRMSGVMPSLIDMADLELSALTAAKRLVVIAATWGEGEPPARAVRAYNELIGEGAPRLDGVEFGVLALGDTAYAEFCAIGKKIDERLAALGGKRVADRVDCDLDYAEPAARWIGDAVKALAPPNAGRVIEVDFGAKPAAAPSTDIFEAEITEHVDLNSSRSDK